MTDPTKYIVQPQSETNLRNYLDGELRKIAASLNALLDVSLEEFDMATAEAGVWTPVVEGLTSAGVGTYTSRHGKFFRWNKLVIVQFRIITSAHTGTGQARINNLPYTVTPETLAGGGFWVCPIFGSAAIALGVANTKNLQFYVHATSAAFNVVNAMDFIGTFSYLTDD